MCEPDTKQPLPPWWTRFWRKVLVTDSCWNWGAGVANGGYGRFQVGKGVVRYAHRLSYETLVGPIGVSMTLDHLCRNSSCVNPAHLEPVPKRINTLRGVGACAQNARKTHCKYGHPFEGENILRFKSSPGGRFCRACRTLRAERTVPHL